MKVASTKWTNPEWEALQDLCNSKGVTIAEYLRLLVREDVDQPTQSESHEAKEKPNPLFQLMGRKKSRSEVDVDDEDGNGFSQSFSTPTLQSQVDALSQEVANHAQTMRETAEQLAKVKNDLDKSKESIPLGRKKVNCFSSADLARYCPR